MGFPEQKVAIRKVWSRYTSPVIIKYINIVEMPFSDTNGKTNATLEHDSVDMRLYHRTVERCIRSDYLDKFNLTALSSL